MINIGKKGFIWMSLLHHNPFLQEVKAETQAKNVKQTMM